MAKPVDLVRELSARAHSLAGAGSSSGAVASRLAGVWYRVSAIRRQRLAVAVAGLALLAGGGLTAAALLAR